TRTPARPRSSWRRLGRRAQLTVRPGMLELRPPRRRRRWLRAGLRRGSLQGRGARRARTTGSARPAAAWRARPGPDPRERSGPDADPAVEGLARGRGEREEPEPDPAAPGVARLDRPHLGAGLEDLLAQDQLQVDARAEQQRVG